MGLCNSRRSRLKMTSVGEPASSAQSTNVVEAGDGTTILDVLNADCWRLVLDQLSTFDIVRSERVSRAWQRMVLQYLAGVHNFWITTSFSDSLPDRIGVPSKMAIFRVIKLSPKNANEVFLKIIKKLGRYFTSMEINNIEGVIVELAAIAENCPNLTDLTIYKDYHPRCDSRPPAGEKEKLGLPTEWKQLKRVTLSVPYGGDSNGVLKLIVTSEALEQLKVTGLSTVTGSFFTHLNSHNLKTLSFSHCYSLQVENIASVVDRLSGLTQLELINSSRPPVRGLHLLLNKLPNLEHLALTCYSEVDLAVEVTAAIGRLSHLKVLNLLYSSCATDEWLAAAARGCAQLRDVDVGGTGVTGHGVIALCRTRPELLKLGVCALKVTDEDLEACARYCRGLKELNANSCRALTRRLPARLAWPRAHPLLLKLSTVYEYNTASVYRYHMEKYGVEKSQMLFHSAYLEDRKKQYEGLTIIWDEDSFDPYYDHWEVGRY